MYLNKRAYLITLFMFFTLSYVLYYSKTISGTAHSFLFKYNSSVVAYNNVLEKTNSSNAFIINLKDTQKHTKGISNKKHNTENETCAVRKPPFQDLKTIHAMWHIVELWSDRIYVIRGYLDERPLSVIGPSVRFVALSSTDMHDKLMKKQFHCIFWLKEETGFGSNEQTFNDKRQLYFSKVIPHYLWQRNLKPVNGIKWKNTYLTCPVPDMIKYGQLYDRIEYVSFNATPCDVTNLVPILHPEKPARFAAKVGE